MTLDLPETFGKAQRKVNRDIRRLKFYEERDSCFGPADVRTEPLIANKGVARYEVRRISNARNLKGQSKIMGGVEGI